MYKYPTTYCFNNQITFQSFEGEVEYFRAEIEYFFTPLLKFPNQAICDLFHKTVSYLLLLHVSVYNGKLCVVAMAIWRSENKSLD